MGSRGGAWKILGDRAWGWSLEEPESKCFGSDLKGQDFKELSFEYKIGWWKGGLVSWGWGRF